MEQVCLELDSILEKVGALKVIDLLTFSDRPGDAATVQLGVGDVDHELTNYLQDHACRTCKQATQGFLYIHHLTALVASFSCLTFDDVCNWAMDLAARSVGTPDGCQQGAGGGLQLVTELQEGAEARAADVAVAQASRAEEDEEDKASPEQHLDSSCPVPEPPAATELAAPLSRGLLMKKQDCCPLLGVGFPPISSSSMQQ